jgi:D-xylose transport system permease protein
VPEENPSSRPTSEQDTAHGRGSSAPTVVEPETPVSDEALKESARGEEPELEMAATAPERLLVVDSLGEYLKAWWVRIRSGESGALPILAGLVIIVVIFQTQQSAFLTAGNIVNLLVLAAVYTLFGAGEIFALLLSEIDLSIGFVGAVGAMIVAELTGSPYNWPWWAAVVVGLAATAAWGAVQGTLITRLHIPSFVVTLGGLLGAEGVLIYVADIDKSAVGGVVRLNTTNVIYELVNNNISPTVSWIVLVVAVGLFALFSLTRAARRRAQGLSAPPFSITILTIVLVAAVGVALVAICNVNRGVLIPLRGVPWVIPFVLVVILAWTFLLGRTRLGRYIYAIGANPEAARRAGINVAGVRTIAFTLCTFTAGLGGLAYESRLGSMGIDVDGGTLVLLAVATAVIGGTSLFGGRGKAVHALLGGLVIAAISNGLGLLGISAAGTYMVTALVLIAAAAVDSLVRRRGSTTTS